jgi:hypothetical protein
MDRDPLAVDPETMRQLGYRTVGLLGDLIASACNIEASYWVQAPGPNRVELTVLGWFKQWVGYPPEAAGSWSAAGRRPT